MEIIIFIAFICILLLVAFMVGIAYLIMYAMKGKTSSYTPPPFRPGNAADHEAEDAAAEGREPDFSKVPIAEYRYYRLRMGINEILWDTFPDMLGWRYFNGTLSNQPTNAQVIVDMPDGPRRYNIRWEYVNGEPVMRVAWDCDRGCPFGQEETEPAAVVLLPGDIAAISDTHSSDPPVHNGIMPSHAPAVTAPPFRKNEPRHLPENLFAVPVILKDNYMDPGGARTYTVNNFAHFPNYNKKIALLAKMAEEENWNHPGDVYKSERFPILENYIKYTYKRIAMQGKMAWSYDGRHACFDTGLLMRGGSMEPIYMSFRRNPDKSAIEYWCYDRCFREGDIFSTRFEVLPQMAFWFDDPSRLLFDARKRININMEHIINERKGRFPEPYNTMPSNKLRREIDACIEETIKRTERNFNLAVPAYYFTTNKVSLLLPLCLKDPDKADMALVIEEWDNGEYRASTVFDMRMARNNARLLARPDADWIHH